MTGGQNDTDSDNLQHSVHKPFIPWLFVLGSSWAPCVRHSMARSPIAYRGSGLYCRQVVPRQDGAGLVLAEQREMDEATLTQYP